MSTTIEPQALTAKEAAALLSLSLRSFQRHVQPHLRVVHVGRLVRIPVTELENYVAQESA
jgi:excisionase family DNA binding protein